MGRAAYVWERGGGDGWVTPDSYERLEADGFSGGATDAVIDAERMREDFAAYTPEMERSASTSSSTTTRCLAHAPALLDLLEAAQPPAPKGPLEELAAGPGPGDARRGPHRPVRGPAGSGGGGSQRPAGGDSGGAEGARADREGTGNPQELELVAADGATALGLPPAPPVGGLGRDSRETQSSPFSAELRRSLESPATPGSLDPGALRAHEPQTADRHRRRERARVHAR